VVGPCARFQVTEPGAGCQRGHEDRSTCVNERATPMISDMHIENDRSRLRRLFFYQRSSRHLGETNPREEIREPYKERRTFYNALI